MIIYEIMDEGPEWIRLDIAATKRLIETWSMAARGCFFSLILCQMERGSLPRDLTALDRLVPGVKKHWSELSSVFVDRDGVLVNEDFDRRRTSALNLIASYRQRGRDGMASRYGHQPGDDGGPPKRDRRSSATSSGINRSDSSASNTATRAAITQPVVSMSMSEEYSPASSSGDVVAERTTHEEASPPADLAERSPRLKLAIAKLPPSLTDAEHGEAVAIIAGWPDASVVTDLNALIEQARKADLPNVYLMGCLRKRRRERPAAQDNAPAIAGRIDPAVRRLSEAKAEVDAEKARVDAALSGLDDESLERLKAQVIAMATEAFDRQLMSGCNVHRSAALRSRMASLLANSDVAAQGATG